MQPTRRARLESVIQQELSYVVPRDIKDPRVPSVTFTAVEVTPDAGMATVFVTLLGGLRVDLSASEDEREKEERIYKKKMKECLEGLNRAKGFLRRHLAGILSIRTIPDLVFKEDKGLENASRVYELLKQINPGDAAAGATATGAPALDPAALPATPEGVAAKVTAARTGAPSRFDREKTKKPAPRGGSKSRTSRDAKPTKKKPSKATR